MKGVPVTAWIEQWHHDTTRVVDLPLPQELEHPECMAGRRLPRLHRRIRQRFPRPASRDCCTYHRQDWALASQTAIRLLSQVHAEGVTGEPAGSRVVELATSEGLAPADVAAVECLVDTLDPISLDDDGGIYEGRHRIQAMIDQGVTHTVLLRLVLLDLATGAPA
ncbi:hypothetical protein [Salinispora arenicola]|uniref:hypothetical protein n=1 Tax=Salinispora arenicola TaxID=168697 RepID=UPI00037BDBF0|nr:hypothetical protein [Salinispora arenicola]